MLSSIDPIAASGQRLRVAFSGDRPGLAAAAVRINAPWLAGAITEDVRNVRPSKSGPGMQLFRSGRWFLGHAQEQFVASELAARSESALSPDSPRRAITSLSDLELRAADQSPTAGLEHIARFVRGGRSHSRHCWVERLNRGYPPLPLLVRTEINSRRSLWPGKQSQRISRTPNRCRPIIIPSSTALARQVSREPRSHATDSGPGRSFPERRRLKDIKPSPKVHSPPKSSAHCTICG